MRTQLQHQVREEFPGGFFGYADIFTDQIIPNPSCFNQVDPLDPHKAADVLLKIASLYNEDSETKTAVFEIVGKCKYSVISFLNR